jgi:hypothetical protein
MLIRDSGSVFGSVSVERGVLHSSRAISCDSQLGASPDYEWNHSGWFLHVDGGGAST